MGLQGKAIAATFVCGRDIHVAIELTGIGTRGIAVHVPVDVSARSTIGKLYWRMAPLWHYLLPEQPTYERLARREFNDATWPEGPAGGTVMAMDNTVLPSTTAVYLRQFRD